MSMITTNKQRDNEILFRLIQMMGLDATEEAEGGVQQPWFAITMCRMGMCFVLSDDLGIVLLSVSRESG